jgi:glycosyltransferase involved in cell wall biosynthesis
VETLIAAAAGTSMRIAVAGEGPERARLQALAEQLRAPVEFLGHVAGEPLRALIREARAIVVPSRWPENCPLVVLEAMASARPLIASRVGGIPELARDGQEALLVEPGDVAGLREALLRLEADTELALRLGRAGRERAQDRYAPSRHMRDVLAVYDRARERRQQAA